MALLMKLDPVSCSSVKLHIRFCQMSY